MVCCPTYQKKHDSDFKLFSSFENDNIALLENVDDSFPISLNFDGFSTTNLAYVILACLRTRSLAFEKEITSLDFAKL